MHHSQKASQKKQTVVLRRLSKNHSGFGMKMDERIENLINVFPELSHLARYSTERKHCCNERMPHRMANWKEKGLGRIRFANKFSNKTGKWYATRQLQLLWIRVSLKIRKFYIANKKKLGKIHNHHESLGLLPRKN